MANIAKGDAGEFTRLPVLFQALHLVCDVFSFPTVLDSLQEIP